MTPRRTAQIFGTDGFDPDISANLHQFYRRLGFKTIASRRYLDADVLVVERPGSEAVDASHYSAVHVYDYIGRPVRGTLESLIEHECLTVFTSSERRRSELLEDLPTLKGRVHVRLPPVFTPYWHRIPTSQNVKWPIVHIGNFKPYYSETTDRYASVLGELSKAGLVNIWGNGWTEAGVPTQLVHGHARLAQVSDIYMRSQLAIGVMYPFQRQVTLSGRFWQAPLAGCPLISEPSMFVGRLPGVTAYESSADVFSVDAASLPERRDLAFASKLFWDDDWKSALDIVGSSLSDIEWVSRSRSRSRSWNLIERREAISDFLRRARHGVR